jgi:hypothetical protein
MVKEENQTHTNKTKLWGFRHEHGQWTQPKLSVLEGLRLSGTTELVVKPTRISWKQRRPTCPPKNALQLHQYGLFGG